MASVEDCSAGQIRIGTTHDHAKTLQQLLGPKRAGLCVNVDCQKEVREFLDLHLASPVIRKHFGDKLIDHLNNRLTLAVVDPLNGRFSGRKVHFRQMLPLQALDVTLMG